jgi:hypothetical protein
MKTFIITYHTLAGLEVMLINEDTIEKAKITAEDYVSEYSFDIKEVDTNLKGLVFYEASIDPRDND